jgi:hypothetical protein
MWPTLGGFRSPPGRLGPWHRPCCVSCGDVCGTQPRIEPVARCLLKRARTALPSALLTIVLTMMTHGRADADPVAVRFIEGVTRGFLTVSGVDGKSLGQGDIAQIAHPRPCRESHGPPPARRLASRRDRHLHPEQGVQAGTLQADPEGALLPGALRDLARHRQRRVSRQGLPRGPQPREGSSGKAGGAARYLQRHDRDRAQEPAARGRSERPLHRVHPQALCHRARPPPAGRAEGPRGERSRGA